MSVFNLNQAEQQVMSSFFPSPVERGLEFAIKAKSSVDIVQAAILQVKESPNFNRMTADQYNAAVRKTVQEMAGLVKA